MKKRISTLLVLIMLFTTLQCVDVKGAVSDTNPLKFGMTTQMLNEGTQGLTEGTQAEESALAKWDISTQGKYELSYYIEAKGKTDLAEVTKKIQLVFDNKDGTNIDVKASTFTKNGTNEDQNTYQRSVLENSSGNWVNETTSTTGSVYKIELKKGALIDRKDRELSFIVSDMSFDASNKNENLKIRVKIEGNTISVWTNGIKKGNVTDFKLTLENVPKGEAQIFNGPKNYKVTPTHLYADGTNLASREVIEDYPNYNDNTEEPGRRPGIKISFSKMKQVDSTIGEFVEIKNPSDAIVILRTDDKKEMKLTFKPKEGAAVIIDGKTTINNVVQEVNNEIAVYLANSEVISNLPGVGGKVIAWDVLQPNKRISSEFEFMENGIEYKNDGYTYLQYDLSKTPSGLVKVNIQPYASDVEATYYIYTANLSTSLENVNRLVWDGLSKEDKQRVGMIWPNQTKKNPANGLDQIIANLSIDTLKYIRVGIEINGKFYTSQIVKCVPSQLLDIPEVTQIRNISNVYVVPDKVNGDKVQPKAIGFDIEWNAPQKVTDYLSKGDLYYELILRTDKDDKSVPGYSKEATYSKIFKVSDLNQSTTSSAVTVIPTVDVSTGTAGKGTEPTKRYDAGSNTFTMENVVLKSLGDTYWEQIKLGDNHWEQPSLTSLQAATLEKDLTGRVVPGVYYLSFRTIFVSKNGSIGVGGESSSVSVSLDNTVEIIPIPTNIASRGRIVNKAGQETDVYNELGDLIIAQDLSFKDISIKNYVDRMLEPAENYLYDKNAADAVKAQTKYKGEYEIYLYQNKDQFKQTLGTPLRPISTTTSSMIEVVSLSAEDIKDLRAGKTIGYKMSYDELLSANKPEFRLQGLDANQVYYVSIRVKLSPWEIKSGLQVDTPALYSLFSAEHAFTTKTIPTPPTPNDKIPPAPKDIWIVLPMGKSTVTLGWSAPEFEQDADISKTYYEFIRSDLQLTKEQMSQTVEALVGADKNKVGFSSDLYDQNAPYMHTYLGSTASWSKLIPEQIANKFNLTDDTLNPNSIYYYYVRTVCVIDNQPVKSSWIMVPVTTSPIAPPINLKVEQPKNYTHDPKKETVVSFDAPIPAGANIPGDYDFEIAVKGELDSEYSATKYSTTLLVSTQDEKLTPEGYRHFVYRINNLKPNKRYDIKVRIIDKTKPLELGQVNYPTSLYCDKVTTRTEYDENTQKEDDAFAEYLKKFDSAVEKLRRRPYWVVEEGTHYKYRESYINTEIALQNEYELITGTNKSEAYYYMPASSLMKISDAATVLKITLGDQIVNIRPYTLTEENEQLKKAIQLKKENELQDYYVAIRVYTSKRAAAINGETPISPEISINMELIYMNQEDMLIEDDIMIELNNLITKHRLGFITQLEKKIQGGTIADDVLQVLVDKAVEDITGDHIKRVERLITRAKKKTIVVNEIEKAMLIISKAESFAVNGYYLEGRNWQDVPSYMTGEGFAMEALKLGIYIFTGQKSLIDTVPEIAPYQTMIAKYNLTDFFTLDNYSINTVVTKQQIYGAIARMMGAARGTDYQAYLKSKGIKGITNVGLNKAIRQDEAIYIIMQGYEMISKKPIASIVIKNKQSVQNIGAFQPPYRAYIYAAVELKIVDNPNSNVLPSKQLSVKEVLKMLNKLQAK